MIRVLIIKKENNIETIEATGHSGYAESGHDIVCAIVSTLTENLIKSLKEVVGIEPISIIDEDIPHLSVSLPRDLKREKMREAQILMQSTAIGLREARDSFSKFIKIKEKHND